jgi:hypothetical protein
MADTERTNETWTIDGIVYSDWDDAKDAGYPGAPVYHAWRDEDGADDETFEM